MKRNLNQGIYKTLGEFIEFLQAWMLLALIDLGLRFRPYAKIKSALNASQGNKSYSGKLETKTVIQNTRRIVSAARRRHLLNITCLRYVLALQWLLARKGIQSEIKFGVQKNDQTLEAHAWLEYQGTPVSESENITEFYTELSRRV